MTSVAYSLVPSPLGPLLLTSDGDALTGLSLHGDRDLAVVERASRCDNERFAPLIAQLDTYFAGRLQQLGLPLARTGTPFQQAVWSALQCIPYGATTSYGELTRRVGRPGAARAVGLSNDRNPITIIIPCHRVIGADGRLAGYGGPRAQAAPPGPQGPPWGVGQLRPPRRTGRRSRVGQAGRPRPA